MPLLSLGSRWKISWDVLIIIAIFASSLVIPYRLVSGEKQAGLLYWLVTFLFIVDVAVNFHTEVKDGLVILTDRREIARYYLSSWFWVDLISALPLIPLFGWVWGPQVSVLALVRLLKLVKVPKLFRALREFVELPPALLRLFVLFFWFSLIAHVMSLGWIAIGGGEIDRPFFDRYIRALYWCITTIATIGYGDYTPNHDSNLQIIYTIAVQVIGVGMFGYIVGNVATLVVNIDAARASFYTRMEEIRNYMRVKRIPISLQNRIKNYYHYLWETRQGITDVDFFSTLPHPLRTEIALFLNKAILEKVPLFKTADEIFLREVVEELEPVVFLPGDFIIRQGQYGDCMYFLNTGQVEVLVNGKRVAILSEGSFFGEMVLIKSEKRSASVRALSYCDTYKLSRHSFERLRQKYPEFDRQISEISREREKSLEGEE